MFKVGAITDAEGVLGVVGFALAGYPSGPLSFHLRSSVAMKICRAWFGLLPDDTHAQVVSIIREHPESG
jgi:hypothetical protein